MSGLRYWVSTGAGPRNFTTAEKAVEWARLNGLPAFKGTPGLAELSVAGTHYSRRVHNECIYDPKDERV